MVAPFAQKRITIAQKAIATVSQWPNRKEPQSNHQHPQAQIKATTHGGLLGKCMVDGERSRFRVKLLKSLRKMVIIIKFRVKHLQSSHKSSYKNNETKLQIT